MSLFALKPLQLKQQGYELPTAYTSVRWQAKQRQRQKAKTRSKHPRSPSASRKPSANLPGKRMLLKRQVWPETRFRNNTWLQHIPGPQRSSLSDIWDTISPQIASECIHVCLADAKHVHWHITGFPYFRDVLVYFMDRKQSIFLLKRQKIWWIPRVCSLWCRQSVQDLWKAQSLHQVPDVFWGDM